MILDLFRNTIKSYRMLKGAKRVFIACSGGPDSVALLHLLVKSQKEWGIEVGVLHANHNLRGKESDSDQQFVKKLADRYRVPFVSASLDVEGLAKEKRLSVEEAARILRYQFFLEAARQYHIDTIALGHTLDDQAETVLMRILSGSGLVGLGAIRSAFQRDGIRFIRPMSQVPKHEILDFLKRNEILYRVDASNFSDRFLRNQIRLNVMPILKKEFGENLPRVLSRIAETTAQDSDFLETTAGYLYFELRKRKNATIVFKRKVFDRLHPSMQFRMVQAALHELGSEFAFDHWRELERNFADHASFQSDLSGGIVCAVNSSTITVKPKEPKVVESDFTDFAYRLDLGQKIRVVESKRTIECKPVKKRPREFVKTREDYVLVDASKLQFPLFVRNRKEGDRFKPLGQTKDQKLKDYLIKQKIPHEKRNSIPLVLAAGRIIWIAGIALSDDAKITSETKQIVKLTLK